MVEDLLTRSDAQKARLAELRSAGARGGEGAHRAAGGEDPPRGAPPADRARVRQLRAQPPDPRPGQSVVEGQPDHAVEPLRRRDLHPDPEGGPLHDLPPGDRPEGIRERPPALHHPSRAGAVRPGRPRHRQGRLHGVPPGAGSRHDLRHRRPHALDQGAGEGLGPVLRHRVVRADAPLGPADAGPGRHPVAVRQVPPRGGGGAEGPSPERGHRARRALRLLRLPQDQGLRDETEGGTGPEQDRLEDQRGVHLPLDQGAAGPAAHPHAAVLGREDRRDPGAPAAQQRRSQRGGGVPRWRSRWRRAIRRRRPATWSRGGRCSRRWAVSPATAWARTLAA